jgi:hypothetical protein
MTEVYRALQQLHCSWVVRARYQVTIRWPAAPSEVDGAVVDPALVEALQGLPRVQLGLQLYVSAYRAIPLARSSARSLPAG